MKNRSSFDDECFVLILFATLFALLFYATPNGNIEDQDSTITDSPVYLDSTANGESQPENSEDNLVSTQESEVVTEKIDLADGTISSYSYGDPEESIVGLLGYCHPSCTDRALTSKRDRNDLLYLARAKAEAQGKRVHFRIVDDWMEVAAITTTLNYYDFEITLNDHFLHYYDIDELAFVIFHELAHVIWNADSFDFPEEIYYPEFVYDFEFPDQLIELQADHNSVRLMIAYGYNPQGSIGALENLSHDLGEADTASHPDWNTRIESLIDHYLELQYGY